MKRLKRTTEIRRYAVLARAEGYPVHGGPNGGGWLRLAMSCGHSGDANKPDLKLFLQRRFPGESGHAPAQAPARRPTEKSTLAFTRHSKIDPRTDAFLSSFEWRSLRMMALKQHGAVCQCCGASPKTGAVMHVDHIKPRKLFPQLALDLNNLQVLCGECNHGKGNWDQTDWREASTKQTPTN